MIRSMLAIDAFTVRLVTWIMICVWVLWGISTILAVIFGYAGVFAISAGMTVLTYLAQRWLTRTLTRKFRLIQALDRIGKSL